MSSTEIPADTATTSVNLTEYVERLEKLSLHPNNPQQDEEVEETDFKVAVPPMVQWPKYVCASCGGLIEGRCITAIYRKFHPEHFVCSYCLKQLNSGTFKEASDKPYCKECFIRLYG